VSGWAWHGLMIRGAALCCVAGPAAWGGLALWYQLPRRTWVRVVGVALWCAFAALTLVAVGRGQVAFGMILFGIAFILLLAWWRGIKPSNTRDWADDVAQMTTGVVEGDHVTLHNVRNFDWRTTTDYSPRWETRTYDLRLLESVDMILSYWTVEPIAHVLISFGFDYGEHVVFSVEIRREKTEKFSPIGGFFKEFELSIIACDERDVIRLRTNVRDERDYLYRIRMPLSNMRSLFLSYVNEANELARTPRFYNTLTVNCTTLVYQMMRRILGRLPLDPRLLFSGYLPGYVHKVGGLDRRFTLEELRRLGRVTERAKKSDRRPSFSADIREGIPAVEPPAEAPGYMSRAQTLE
jgi:hypothetical protein